RIGADLCRPSGQRTVDGDAELRGERVRHGRSSSYWLSRATDGTLLGGADRFGCRWFDRARRVARRSSDGEADRMVGGLARCAAGHLGGATPSVHRQTQARSTRYPSRHYLDRLRERHVQRMDSLAIEDVNSTRKRSGNRRHEDGVTVVELLDDEGRHERVFDLSQRGLPDLFATVGCHLLGKAAKQRISGNSFEERFLDALTNTASSR